MPAAAAHCSSSSSVPLTFTVDVRRASSIARPDMPAAAKWNTTSAPATSRLHAAASVTLPSMVTSRVAGALQQPHPTASGPGALSGVSLLHTPLRLRSQSAQSPLHAP